MWCCRGQEELRSTQNVGNARGIASGSIECEVLVDLSDYMGLKVVIGRIQLHHHSVIVGSLVVDLKERGRVIVQIEGGLSSAYDREGIDPSRVWLQE